MITMDSPSIYYRFINGGHKVMTNSILKFCGIKTKKISEFTPIKKTPPKKLEFWLNQSYQKGLKLI